MKIETYKHIWWSGVKREEKGGGGVACFRIAAFWLENEESSWQVLNETFFSEFSSETLTS